MSPLAAGGLGAATGAALAATLIVFAERRHNAPRTTKRPVEPIRGWYLDRDRRKAW